MLQILPISQIHKRRGIQVPSFQAPLHLGLDAISFLVLPAEKQPQNADDSGFDQVRYDHGPDSEFVDGSGYVSFIISLLVGNGVKGSLTFENL